MMDFPLNSWTLFAHMQRHFPTTEIVTRTPSGSVRRVAYDAAARRSQQLMWALDHLGVGTGETVATLAWNGHRHLECYFAVPCTGRVLHTLNARLSPEDLAYIIGHADDQAIFVDDDLLPTLQKVRSLGGLERVRHIVVMGDDADLGAWSLPGVVSYEDLIVDEPDHYGMVDIPEQAPLGLCYTSGTTGRPRGVRYTHRSTFLHSMAVGSAAGMDFGPRDCVLPVVPMYHANAWGVPFAATAVGAKQVFYGGPLQAGPLVDLLTDERVTVTAGVPTIWLEVAEELARAQRSLPDLRHIVCGGSQPPRPLIERYLTEFGVPLVQAWGMTETSPMASIAWPKREMADWPHDAVMDHARTQAGLPLPGVDVTIRDDEGNDVDWDGHTMGNLLVRGPWVADAYLGGEEPDRFTDDGWFFTGDVAIGSPHGYFVIADRTKDLIKSGGEWISSLDMEAAIMTLPQVAEAAVVALPDPKWQERPVACIVLRPAAELDLTDLREHLEGSGFAKWQLPDRMELIDVVPRTSVGKTDKKTLRARFADQP